MSDIVQLDLVATSASHSAEVVPSFAPPLVSKALFTAVLESVSVKPVVVDESAFIMLSIDARVSFVADEKLIFCPILPSILIFWMLGDHEKVSVKVWLPSSLSIRLSIVTRDEALVNI
jgi:hypothetical protein